MYVAMTYVSEPIAFREVQFRISEVLVFLVFINPKYIIGISLGTFIANFILSPFGPIDAILGTIISALAMGGMIAVSKLLGKGIVSSFVASVFPVVLNAFYVAGLIVCSSAFEAQQTLEILKTSEHAADILSKTEISSPLETFYSIAISVGIGEAVVVSVFGVVLVQALQKNRSFIKTIKDL